MKKVLICISSLSRANGIASFIMNTYEKLLLNNFKIDFFLVLSDVESDNKYLDKIKENGGNVYYALPHNKINRLAKTKKKMSEILKYNDYDIVHVNLIDVYALGCIMEARKKKINKIIYHIHNPKTKTKLGKISDVINNMCIKYSNQLVACSDDAGKSMFKNEKFSIVTNAIDTNLYKFDEKSRKKYREEFNLENNIVIGVVARIIEQKNPFFIVDILSLLKQEIESVKLLWIGTGPLENKLINYIKEKKLTDNVVFAGSRHDANKIYSAMDVFLLPSRYEGFGIVFIEAQANGLITFSSDNVPQSVKTTDLISFIKLEYGPELWKQEIIKRLQNKNYSRDDKTFVNKIIAEGYDVRNSKFDLVNIYNSEREGEKC